MKYLYYSSCSFAFPHFGVLLDEAYLKKKEGHELRFVYCNQVLTSCFMNISGNVGLCKLCKIGYKNSLSLYFDETEIIPMSAPKQLETTVYKFDKLSDLKKVNYKGINIGYSIVSTYISLTRDIEPDMDSSHERYFSTLINELKCFIDSVFDLIEKEKPDIISVYGGRFFENRVFYDISQILGIKFVANETVGGNRSNEKFSKVRFIDSLPHDLKAYTKRVLSTWELSLLPEDEKMIIGKSFYEKRRIGLPAGDKVYIKAQKSNSLPANYDSSKKNIVVFNSSQDEFASIGKEWEEGSLFESQYSAMEFILKSVNDNKFHFYFRIHPNLANVKFSYHMDLFKLKEKFKNVTIIAADDSISTYSLLDIADKVLVFGSTMGVEASFWKKPVILLNKSLYYYLDVAYIPLSEMELLEMIENDNLIPKNNLNTIKYGFYSLDRIVNVFENGEINYNYGFFNFMGVKIREIKYLKIFNSSKIFKLFFSALSILLSVSLKLFPVKLINKNIFPGKVFKM